MTNTTAFSLYKLGYIDGYLGNEMKLSNNENYVWGYEKGLEDDLLGVEMRYSRDESG